MLVMDTKKIDYRVQIDAELAEQADDSFKLHGVTRTEGVARLLEWFKGQSEEVRSMAMGQLPESLHIHAAKIMLEQFAGG